MGRRMGKEGKSGTRREPWTPLLCSYPDSVKINRLSFEAETLYTRLLAQSDDRGNYDGDPVLIAAGVFRRRFRAGQVDIEKVQRWRDELVAVGLACLYEHDGETYIHLVGAKKFLRAARKRDYRYPECPAGGAPVGLSTGRPIGTPSGAPTGAPSGAPTGAPTGAPMGTPSGSHLVNQTASNQNHHMDATWRTIGVGVGEGEGVVVVPPAADDDDDRAEPSLNPHFAEHARKLIDTWNEFAPRKVSAAEMLEVDRQYVPLITGVPPNRFSPEELLGAVENYRAALALPNSQAGRHTLGGFFKTGVFRKFISGTYNPDHFDGSRFKKTGNERNIPKELEEYRERKRRFLAGQ